MSAVIHQIPHDIEFVVAGAAGKRLEVFTDGSDTFDRVNAVRLR